MGKIEMFLLGENEKKTVDVMPIKKSDDSKWKEDSSFLDAPIFYAANTIKERCIKKGNGLRLDFDGIAKNGKTVATKIIGKYAQVEIYNGQSYKAVLRIIDKRFKDN